MQKGEWRDSHFYARGRFCPRLKPSLSSGFEYAFLATI